MLLNTDSDNVTAGYTEVGLEESDHGILHHRHNVNIFSIGQQPDNAHVHIDLAHNINDNLPIEGLILDLGCEGVRSSMPVSIVLPERAVTGTTSLTLRISYGPASTEAMRAQLDGQEEPSRIKRELEEARATIGGYY